MQSIPEILSELGYRLTPDSDGWRARPIYRESGNDTSLKIYSNGSFIDFSASISGNFEQLVQLSAGLKNIDEAKAWLKGKTDLNLIDQNYQKPQIKIPAVFDQSVLKDLIPDYSYIEKRGISIETARTFSCGLCINSQTLIQKLKNRQVFCIYNSNRQLVGLSGRAIYNDVKIRHKHLGDKSSWVYPAHINNDIIKSKREIILVEGIFDLMRLWDLDIKNVIVIWGTECSHAILNYLLKINPHKIIIATNNEPDNNYIGNQAAEKIYNRLKRYFDSRQLMIHLPPAKDFCEIRDDREILKWKQDYEAKI